MNSPQLTSDLHSEVEQYAYTPSYLDPNRIRSRRNTFTYGDFSPCPSPTVGSSSVDAHSELVPYSKEWTVIFVHNGQSTPFVQPSDSTQSSSSSFLDPIIENISSLSESSFNQGYYERFFIEERKLEEFIDVQPTTFSMQKDSNEHLTPKERLLRARRMFYTGHLSEQPTLNSPLPSKRHLNLREICSLFMDICEGLDHLHKQVTPILDNDIRSSNSSHASSSHMESEKLSRIPSNTSTVTTNPGKVHLFKLSNFFFPRYILTYPISMSETSESTDENEINESELRRRRINIETTDGISTTPNFINTTVESDFVVEQVPCKVC
ncbi:17085_t:CDS:2 [Racocetra fulgida]|uniref:17085_t:CDS:1 n=1 Tax=Racocetra fulgida TaxID=60492 RepID=A0A9N9CHW0_9GLOM|nr:17085_t:CDS:2 [Racocetra fulgida]